ncbi:MAG TPA: metalloregulator ArsR/SmtB family transcription factor [Patescibacteria group bacterium]|jgi:DNA-binding transcriptional ArsR family regulator|nr:metalloregulator ArsR/SmtB family transcription factor [Patescibacteria group bacterium]
MTNIEQKARIFSLFGDPTRLRILKILLKKKSIKVSDIADGVGMSVACISHHLQLLKDNQLVSAKREGNNVFYQLKSTPLVKSLEPLIK